MSERVYAAAELIDDYLKRILRDKIQVLGSGAEGTVFQHPTHPNIVVKIAPRFSGSYSWAEESKKHKDNPFFLRIHGIFEVKLRHTRQGNEIGYCLIFMEKLKPITNALTLDAIFGAAFLEWLQQSHNPKRSLFLKYVEEVKDPDAKVALVTIVLHRPSHILVDITYSNILLRGNQPVFVDPWLRSFF